MTLDACPHGLFALDQEQLRSPYDLYRQWREMGPVVYLEDQDIYIVTRHDLIKSVNRQPRPVFQPESIGPPLQRWLPRLSRRYWRTLARKP